MKLPNGFGSVTKLSGNRRRPFIARKLLGYKDNGQQYYKAIGYYETYADAILALKNYNGSNDIKPLKTFSSVYNEWLSIHSIEVGASAIESYKTSYKHLSQIAGKAINAISYTDLQNIIDRMRSNSLSYASCKKVRSLLNMVFNHAIINGLIEKSYSQYLKLGRNIPVKPHKPFSRQKINRLWNLNTFAAQTVLILLYTGMRCSEMLSLTHADVNLKSRYFIVRQSKTEAGRNRIIPIHDRILPFVEKFKQTTSTHLIEHNNHPLTYAQYAEIFSKVMHMINAKKHTTHDCRHTVASLLDAACANPASVRAILGHKNGDITLRVYTHKSLRELRKAINLLK